MQPPIEYIGRSSQYYRNVYELKINDQNVTNRDLIQFIEDRGYDHNTFGTHVERGADFAYVHFYTD
jgi:hypothetical protein